MQPYWLRYPTFYSFLRNKMAIWMDKRIVLSLLAWWVIVCPTYAQVAAPSLLPSSIQIGDPEELPHPNIMTLNPAADALYLTPWLINGRFISVKSNETKTSRFTGVYHGIRSPILGEDGSFKSETNPYSFVEQAVMFSVATVETQSCDRIDYSTERLFKCKNNSGGDEYRASSQHFAFTQTLEDIIVDSFGLSFNKQEIKTDNTTAFYGIARFGFLLKLWPSFLSFGAAHEWNQIDIDYDPAITSSTDNTTTFDRKRALRETTYGGLAIFYAGDNWGIHLEGYGTLTELNKQEGYREFDGEHFDKIKAEGGSAELKIYWFTLGSYQTTTKNFEKVDGEETLINTLKQTSYDVGFVIPIGDWGTKLNYHVETTQRVYESDSVNDEEMDSASVSFSIIYKPGNSE